MAKWKWAALATASVLAILSSPFWVPLLPERLLTRTVSTLVTPSVEMEADYPFQGGGRGGSRLGRSGARAFVRSKKGRTLLLEDRHIAVTALSGGKAVLLTTDSGESRLVVGETPIACFQGVASPQADRVACLRCEHGEPHISLCHDLELVVMDAMGKVTGQAAVLMRLRCYGETPAGFTRTGDALLQGECSVRNAYLRCVIDPFTKESFPTSDVQGCKTMDDWVRTGAAEPPKTPDWYPTL